MSFTLNVEITPEDWAALVEKGWNLCITQNFSDGDVPMRGNVVFAVIPSTKLSTRPQFRWENENQVFMSETFKPGMTVKPDTEICDVKAGQSVTFDKDGTGTYGPSKQYPIEVRNDWKDQGHVGVNISVGSGCYATTFISSPTELQSTSGFMPTDSVSVFFSQEYKIAGTMINVITTTNVFPVRFGQKTTARVLYKHGKWFRVKEN